MLPKKNPSRHSSAAGHISVPSPLTLEKLQFSLLESNRDLNPSVVETDTVVELTGVEPVTARRLVWCSTIELHFRIAKLRRQNPFTEHALPITE